MIPGCTTAHAIKGEREKYRMRIRIAARNYEVSFESRPLIEKEGKDRAYSQRREGKLVRVTLAFLATFLPVQTLSTCRVAFFLSKKISSEEDRLACEMI